MTSEQVAQNIWCSVLQDLLHQGVDVASAIANATLAKDAFLKEFPVK